jgi:alkylation response protein AidB-like acyl-CoA dehydrogenase
MDLLPSSEQVGIIESSAAFVTKRIPISRTRELFEAGSLPAIDDAAWAEAVELGWLALGLPSELGGIGAGLADEVLLLREIGRGLVPGPFISTILGARVAAFGGAEGLADEIVNGRKVGLVVPASLDVVGVDGTLDGAVQLIDASDGLALVTSPDVAAIVDVAAFGDLSTVPGLDATMLLQRATASSVAPVVAVRSQVDPVERRGQVMVAAVLTGIAEWGRDTSSQHAIDRVQFDKPIGVNQAIKHPCADMAVQAQLAYAQSLFAALATDEGRADAELQALSARITAAAAAEYATSATVQVLGGMGFTHEHDAHLYAKKATVLTQVFADLPTALHRLLALPEPN